jgi:ornithine cyclodeaminase/alanine dehydrogenase-like protein (mu-crystallin family)
MSGPSSKLRLINRELVRELLPMPRCIDLMRDAFIQVSEGRAVQPIRQMVRTPDGKGMMGWMPGYTDGPGRLGIKVICIFPEAVAKGIPSHQGAVMLFDAEDGRPLALLDAAEITAIRTAAATAVATGALARADATSLSIFGYGEQAHSHLTALMKARAFDKVLIWGRDADKARRFCALRQGEFDVPLEVAETAEEASGADVVCLVTGSSDPVFKGAWLKPGQHINAVGSSIPAWAEVDAEAVARCRYFVDYRASAELLAGELKRAREAGAVGEDHILGEVGEVLLSKVQGRRSAQDITMFKSLGMVAEDLLSAGWVLEEAERRDLGLTIDW